MDCQVRLRRSQMNVQIVSSEGERGTLRVRNGNNGVLRRSLGCLLDHGGILIPVEEYLSMGRGLIRSWRRCLCYCD